MLITDEIWCDEWFCSLEQRQKLLYLYLLGNCSKCGIFELNMRKINFDLSNGMERVRLYTAKEILTFAGNRIQQINESKAIIVKYIQFNWVRDKPLNPDGNPLHRGLANELAKYGLSFDKLNEMAGKESIRFERIEDNVVDDVPSVDSLDVSVSAKNREELFDAFWKEYPSSCPRKIDKKKCRIKFDSILMKSDDAVQMFNRIMNGLAEWKQSSMWNSDDGKFICAPLVWLNGDRWNDNPMKGGANGNIRKGSAGSVEYKASSKEDIGW